MSKLVTDVEPAPIAFVFGSRHHDDRTVIEGNREGVDLLMAAREACYDDALSLKDAHDVVHWAWRQCPTFTNLFRRLFGSVVCIARADGMSEDVQRRQANLLLQFSSYLMHQLDVVSCSLQLGSRS